MICPITLQSLDQPAFARIDYRVMRAAFDSQNRLGRLCDEVIYQNDLAVRLQIAGPAPVRREVPVTVTYRDFAKPYRLDLVVNDAAIYELKTEARLSSLERRADPLPTHALTGVVSTPSRSIEKPGGSHFSDFRAAQYQSFHIPGMNNLTLQRPWGIGTSFKLKATKYGLPSTLTSSLRI